MNVITKLKPYFLLKPAFHIGAAVLMTLAVFGVFIDDATSFISQVKINSFGILAGIIEIKQVLSSVSGLKLPFIDQNLSSTSESFNKLENAMLVSTVIISIQMILISISSSLTIKYATILLFFGSFIKSRNQLCQKLLILLLALNPGLALYSVTIEHLSTQKMTSFDSGLNANLTAISSKLRAEQIKLYDKHQQEQDKITDSKSHFKLLRHLASDVAYGFRKIEGEVKTDFKEISSVLHLGAKKIIEDVIAYTAKALFYMFLLPLGYVALVYLIYRNLVTSTYRQSPTQEA